MQMFLARFKKKTPREWISVLNQFHFIESLYCNLHLIIGADVQPMPIESDLKLREKKRADSSNTGR